MTSLLHLALLLSAVIAIPVQAAIGNSVPDAIPVEELTELEEVRVRGKLVTNAVITAENRVFRLYNKLNRNNRFDVHCVDLRLDWDTMVMQRTCLPEFVGYQSAASVGYGYTPPQPFSHYSEPPLICGSDTCYSPDSFSSPAFNYRSTPMANITALPGPAPAVMVSDEERAEYSQNVLRVIRSDPQLLGMATELVGMYQEMERVQDRYLQLREERKAAQAARKAEASASGRPLRPSHPRGL